MRKETVFLIPLVLLISYLSFLFVSPKIKIAEGVLSSTTIESGVTVTIGATSTGGGGFGIKNPANLTFSGFAYPGAVITITDNGDVAGTVLAREDGTFIKTVTIDPGFITFGVTAKDNYGLDSAVTNFTINVQSNQNIDVSNIFLSPTITADRFKFQKGGTLRIYGSAFPKSIIRVFNNFSASGNPIGTASTNINGLWEYFLPTEDLGDGKYSLKVNAEMSNQPIVSPFSKNLEFTIAEIQCHGADFNFDTRVNVIDFSILIFYWERNPAIGQITNICTDLNTDKIVNIYDFSILMHEWTN